MRSRAAVSFRAALGVRIRTEAGGGYRMQMQDHARRLLWHGIFLFLLGLITGLAIPIISNHRMGLSAHLEALLNGILLLALGCLWPQLRLSAKAVSSAFWLALYGTYANWFFTLLGAILGTKALTPQAGAGFTATPLSEIVVGFGLVTLATVMLIVCVILLVGLSGKPAPSERIS